jgi:DNA repair protein RadC
MQYVTGCACSLPHWSAKLTVLWLDNQHRLIAHDTLFTGTINTSPVIRVRW